MTQRLPIGLQRHGGWLLLWTLIWFVSFATLLLAIAHLPSGDMSGQFHAFARFQGRQLAQGIWPLWSNGSYAGFPFVADPQSAVYYLPRWLLLLLFGAADFPFYALELEALLHLWLAGAGAYLFLAATTGSRPAALFGACAWALSAFATTYPMLQLAILETIAWLPLLLWLVQRWARQKGSLALSVLIGLVLAGAITAGHAQTALQSGYLLAAYWLYRIAMLANWRLLRQPLLALLIAVGASAAAWMPTLNYVGRTTRAAVDYSFVAGGMPLQNYAEWWLPGLYSQWTPVYVGIATLPLALSALLLRRRAPASEINFWGVTLIVSWLLSLGDSGHLFAAAYRWAPGFALFRQQERWIALVTLALAVLAAHGILFWQQRGRARLPAALLWIIACFAIASITYLADPAAELGRWWPLALRQLILLGAAALLLVGLSPRQARLRFPLLLLLLLIDLYVVRQGAIELEPGSPAVFWPTPDWLSELQQSSSGSRIDSLNIFWSNFGEIYGLQDIRGISPLKLDVLDQIEALPLPRQWQLLNVTHVLWDGPPTADVPLTPIADMPQTIVPGETRQAQLYRIEQPNPRAWLVYDALYMDAESNWRQLADLAFDVRRQVILPLAAQGAVVLQPPTRPPQLEVVRQRAGAVTLSVDSETAGLLVVSEWMLPGWQARVDGRPVATLPAYHALHGVPLSAGSHVVELSYQPPAARRGLALSALTLLLSVTLLIASRRRAPAPDRRLRLPGRRLLPPARRLPLPDVALPPWLPALALITLLAFALRVTSAATQDLRSDEAASYLITSGSFADIVPNMMAASDPHPPLHYLTLAVAQRLVGSEEIGLRIVAIMVGTLLVPLTAQLGRRSVTPAVGLLAAALLACSQSQIWIAQDVRSQYMLALLFALAATLVLQRRLAAPSRQGWLLYACCALLTMASHYYGIFALLAHGVWLLLARRDRLRGWLLAGAAAALAFLPWLLLLYRRTISEQLSAPGKVELDQHLNEILRELASGTVVGFGAQRWVVVLALLLIAVALTQPPGRLRRQRALFVAWLLLALWGIFLVRMRRPIFNSFYVSIAAPAFWILVAAGLLALWRRRSAARPLAVLLTALLFGANLFSLWNYYRYPAQYARTIGYQIIGDYLAANAAADDLFVAHAPDPSLVYYVEPAAISYTMQPQRPGMAHGEIEQSLQQLGDSARRIWFVPAKPELSFDPDNFVPGWMEGNLLHAGRLDAGRLALHLYQPPHAAGELLQPLAVSLADELALTGASVLHNGLPYQPDRALSGGDSLEVSLLWQALGAGDTDYAVFVHLLDADGRLIAQHDGTPVFGTRPTSTWQQGERLIDIHLLTLTDELQPGPAQLLVGVYRRDSLQRQLLSNGATELRLIAPMVEQP